MRKVFRTRKRIAGTPRRAALAFFARSTKIASPSTASRSRSKPGELVGYIGPNGAGKSTTIKMLTGILVPTSGEVRVAGLVPWQQRKENARNIGVVFGQRSQLYWDLPLIESFELLRAIYGVPRDQYRRNLDEFVEILEMASFLRTPVRQLSLGQRMRGDFAAALLHSPTIVYLDEPTIGLDVVAKEAIREFIARINAERGATIVLTTHDLADVERLCRRIVLIDRGTLIYDGDIERIKSEYGRFRTLVVRFCEPVAQPHLDGARARRRRRLRARASGSTATCSAPICSCGKRANVTASKTSASKSPISSRSFGGSTSKDTIAERGGRVMILSSGTKKPKIHSSAYVAPTATISGDVTIGAGLRGPARRGHHRRRRAGHDRRDTRRHGERRAQSQRRQRAAVSAVDRRPLHRRAARLRRRRDDRQRLLRRRAARRFSTAPRSRTAAASRWARSST